MASVRVCGVETTGRMVVLRGINRRSVSIASTSYGSDIATTSSRSLKETGSTCNRMAVVLSIRLSASPSRMVCLGSKTSKPELSARKRVRVISSMKPRSTKTSPRSLPLTFFSCNATFNWSGVMILSAISFSPIRPPEICGSGALTISRAVPLPAKVCGHEVFGRPAGKAFHARLGV